jgi:hypothetical protein
MTLIIAIVLTIIHIFAGKLRFLDVTCANRPLRQIAWGDVRLAGADREAGF